MHVVNRSGRPAGFPAGLKLAEEEHEHEQNGLDLLVAQLKLDGQRKHGNGLVCAGVHAN